MWWLRSNNKKLEAEILDVVWVIKNSFSQWNFLQNLNAIFSNSLGDSDELRSLMKIISEKTQTSYQSLPGQVAPKTLKMKLILVYCALVLIVSVYGDDDNSLSASEIDELKQAYSTQVESRAGFVCWNWQQWIVNKWKFHNSSAIWEKRRKAWRSSTLNSSAMSLARECAERWTITFRERDKQSTISNRMKLVIMFVEFASLQ